MTNTLGDSTTFEYNLLRGNNPNKLRFPFKGVKSYVKDNINNRSAFESLMSNIKYLKM